MRIRPGSDQDAAAVAALWTEGYTGTGPEGRKTPYVAADYFEAAADGRAFVAEGEGERLDGVIVYRSPVSEARAVAGPGEAEQARLVVAAAARGRGVGRALAQRCLELARAEGAAVALWSRAHQVEAHRLYESLGYRRAPERDCADADGARLVFVLELG